MLCMFVCVLFDEGYFQVLYGLNLAKTDAKWRRYAQ